MELDCIIWKYRRLPTCSMVFKKLNICIEYIFSYQGLNTLLPKGPLGATWILIILRIATFLGKLSEP